MTSKISEVGLSSSEDEVEFPQEISQNERYFHNMIDSFWEFVIFRQDNFFPN